MKTLKFSGWLSLCVMGLHTACSPTPSEDANFKPVDIVIGVKDGPLTLVSLDEEKMLFGAPRNAAPQNANYVRFNKSHLWGLQPDRLNVWDMSSADLESSETEISSEALSDPTAIEVTEDNQFVFTAHFSDNSLVARRFDGKQFSKPQIFECGWAHQFRPHPNKKWAYAACMKNTVRQFNIDPNTKTVESMFTPKVMIEGGPRHLEFHPDGQALYVLLQISSEVAVYDINNDTGALSSEPKQVVPTTTDASKNKSSDLHITPDGKWLYAFNRRDQTMAIFDVSPNHSLKLNHVIAMDEGEVRDWAMSSEGDYLITASNEGFLGLWEINSQTGMLNLRDELTGLGNAISVAIAK